MLEADTALTVGVTIVMSTARMETSRSYEEIDGRTDE